jgi:DNA-binding transcriptional LysR family regulator
MPSVSRPGDCDRDDLRYFLAAARAGTLAGAARAMGVEHSTVGRRLTGLEDALGVPLLTRGPDGLALTEVGPRLVPLVEQVERAVQAVRELAIARKSRVRLATPSGFTRFLSPHLGEFQARHPSITLEVMSGSRPVDLRRGEADLAVRTGPATTRIWSAARSATRGGRCTRRRLTWPATRHRPTRAPLPGTTSSARPHPAEGAGGAVDRRARSGANVIMRCREMAEMARACAAGLGLAVLPCLLAQAEPPLRRLTPQVLGSRRIALVYRKEALATEAVVLDFLSDVVRQYGPQFSGET